MLNPGRNMLTELIGELGSLVSNPALEAARVSLAGYVARKGRVFILANGGTFANCEHVAVDWIKQKSLNVDIPASGGVLTCFGNDYQFENIYSKYLEHKGMTGNDLVIALSSSGASLNILNAAKYARDAGAELWTGWGMEKDRPLSQYGSIQFYIDSKDYNVIEIGHLAALLAL